MRLEASGVQVRYGAHRAVENVDLVAEKGEVLAILGANGSGKSSLLKALAGVQKHAGRIDWQGEGRLGYMPQETAVRAALTVFEVVLLGRVASLALRVDRADLDAAREALEELGISQLASRSIAALSGGQRQLAFLAQVLAAGPRALLLDEPTSALDVTHQLRVLETVRETTRRRKLTTILVLHDLNAAARYADRLVLMSGGRLIGAGCAAAVLTPAHLRLCYGVEAAVLEGPDGAPVILPLRPAV